jgi:hypothetical protein
VGAIDLRRCRHCVRPLLSLQIDERDEFALRSPAVVCERCDGEAHDEDPVFLPDGWE